MFTKIISVTLLIFVFLAPTTLAKTQNAQPGQVQNQQQNQLGQDDLDGDEGSTTKNNFGQINAQAHRSTVANFVHDLLQVADRQGGIGQQVRVIAQQQNQSASTTVQAMEQVQTRSKVKTFLFGSDYKNLGTLRSEVVQTRNRLNQLNNLKENVQNQADETELQNQIQTMEEEQTRIENFIEEQESKFSLFGWLLKLFTR